MDKYKIVSVDGIEYRGVEPHDDIVSTGQEIQALERYQNNPHLYFELPEPSAKCHSLKPIESSAIVC